jgi:hypothetical protein
MTPADLASSAVTAAAVTGTASSHAVWYFTRGTGIVALLLLTASLLLGPDAETALRRAALPALLVDADGRHRRLGRWPAPVAPGGLT